MRDMPIICLLQSVASNSCKAVAPMQCVTYYAHAIPGPATQLAKGYASLFQKTLRKGLFSSFLYVPDIGKKGPF